MQSVFTFRTALTYELALSRRLYQAIIQADWLFLVRRRSSDFTHALTAELARVTTCAYLLIGTLSSAILSLVYIAIALKLSAGMTLPGAGDRSGACCCFRVAGCALSIQSGTAVSESVSEVYAAATEHLQNLKAMKFYDAQSSDTRDVFLAPIHGPGAKPVPAPGARPPPPSGLKPARSWCWEGSSSLRCKCSR